MSSVNRDEQIIAEIMDLVTQLGWNVAIPNTDDNEPVKGLIIGTDEFINSYVSDGENDESLH